MLIGDKPRTIRCRDKLLDLAHPIVMGIINATPDSFYAPSRVSNEYQYIIDKAGQQLDEGAAIIDIGGMSSRPGSSEITEAEEIDRLLPVIAAVHNSFPDAILSVDTFRANVARQSILQGACIINDISGAEWDENLVKIAVELRVPYVLMHIKGRPADMQQQATYADLMKELVQYFVDKLRRLAETGVTDVIIDPGFGFAKNMQQNYELIRKLNVLNFLDRPIMIGLSRKSTLSRTINRPVEQTLEATSALHMSALLNGTDILRVHDVQAAMDVIAVYRELRLVQNP